MLNPDELRSGVIGAAIEVHRRLGPGLLESVYETCLEHELRRRGMQVARQAPVVLRFDDLVLDAAFRIDLVVNQRVVIEIKAVEKLLPVHEYQLLTYLRLSGLPVGLLLNFNTVVLRDGIRRKVNGPTR